MYDLYSYMVNDLGYPDHVAAAFMDNFQAESGLNPTINERNPVVPGSRGGRGLYQLTGSRRDQYEGLYGDEYEPFSQLDFMDWELNNSEVNARDAIFSAPDRASATKAITQKFLRPLHDNSDARVGAWQGLNEKARANSPGRDKSHEKYRAPPIAAGLHEDMFGKIGKNRMAGLGGALRSYGLSML